MRRTLTYSINWYVKHGYNNDHCGLLRDGAANRFSLTILIPSYLYFQKHINAIDQEASMLRRCHKIEFLIVACLVLNLKTVGLVDYAVLLIIFLNED
jgi:hypothetical protein